jgi:hypothetical protein
MQGGHVLFQETSRNLFFNSLFQLLHADAFGQSLERAASDDVGKQSLANLICTAVWVIGRS